jgi:hypothetical protein
VYLCFRTHSQLVKIAYKYPPIPQFIVQIPALNLPDLSNFEFQSSYQMANLSFLLSVLALSLLAVFAADATTLLDFCVTNPIGQGI